jgi:small subunit ribosomal protein S19
MSRSSKKGPYIDEVLLNKIRQQKGSGDRTPIKTWSRASMIAPDYVGHSLLIHNGRGFEEVFISESMVGHRLGEFSPTRTFRGHGRMVKRIIAKT